MDRNSPIKTTTQLYFQRSTSIFDNESSYRQKSESLLYISRGHLCPFVSVMGAKSKWWVTGRNYLELVGCTNNCSEFRQVTK